ncbi:ParA family protein [Salibacterium salarium]|uniref:ParA family protein n=1 Tax=Salibacterium salarium TaxID=284579 RepID=A0A3R9RAA4_9BACI|nr:AAA family ATPase [Salibacterium salarium]RSL30826.1 ParA family protein [Salibacterium salarium]
MDIDFIPGKSQQQLVKVVIADDEKVYMNDISSYYEQSEDVLQVVQMVERFDDLKLYILNHSVDIVIVNESLIPNEMEWGQLLKDGDLVKLVVITDNLQIMNEKELKDERIDLLYKYTPIGTYTSKLLSFPVKGKDKDIFTQVNPASKDDTTQKSILFYSPKGGVGTTTLTVNVGSQLAIKGKKVLLVDFAVFGHISVAFSLPQRSKGLSDIISFIEQGRDNVDELKEVMNEAVQTVSVHGKEIDILSAGPPLKMSSLTLEQTDYIMKAIYMMEYDHIIFDTSSELSEKNISLLNASTDLVFVMTTDVSANWSLLSSVDVIRRLNNPLQNRYLVINGYHESIGFPVREVEEMLSMQVSAIVPYKYDQVQGFANRGTIMAEKPYLKLNKHYRSIANLIDPIFSQSEVAKRNGLKKGVLA